MRRKKMVIGLVLSVLVFAGAIALSAQQSSIWIGDKAEQTAMPGISIDSAINAAKQAVPGTVIGAELENENGYLVYGVEIVKPDNQIMDVKVDAGNGKVLIIERDHEDREDYEREDFDNGREKRGER